MKPGPAPSPSGDTLGTIGDTLGELGKNIIAFFVMIILAVIGFFFTIFVVDFGATLAGRSAGADFVVLSASLLVAASILAGSGSPVAFLGRPISDESEL